MLLGRLWVRMLKRKRAAHPSRSAQIVARKLKVDVSPIDGNDVRARIESIAKVPPEVMKGVEKLITSN